MEETKLLSKCEEVIMKAIWDLADEESSIIMESVQLTELIDHLEKKYEKKYARTTVITFLTRMSEKGAVWTYRKGRYSYVVPQYSMNEYKKILLSQMVSFWYDGEKSKLISEIENLD